MEYLVSLWGANRSSSASSKRLLWDVLALGRPEGALALGFIPPVLTSGFPALLLELCHCSYYLDIQVIWGSGLVYCIKCRCSLLKCSVCPCTSSSLKREPEAALLGWGVAALAWLLLGFEFTADAKRSCKWKQFFFLQLKRPELNRFRASTRHFAEYFTSSSSSSNSDKAALLVLLWLEISGLDLLLGMTGNS